MFLRKHIATSDFPGGGVQTPVTPLDPCRRCSDLPVRFDNLTVKSKK